MASKIAEFNIKATFNSLNAKYVVNVEEEPKKIVTSNLIKYPQTD